MKSSKATLTPQTRNLQCNGLIFPVLIWGPAEGRPILLLHGFPQEPSTWSPLAEILAEGGFQVFAPFLRGYTPGARPKEMGGYTFANFLQDAIGIADTLQLHKFDVAGFGMGGVLAWMLAAFNPDRIRSLTSLRYPHPAAFAHGIQFEPEQRAKWQHLEQKLGATDLPHTVAAMLANDAADLQDFLQTSGLPQPFLDRYVARLKEPGALAGALAWQRAVSPEAFSRVPSVTVPTLLLWSEGPGLARSSVAATKNYVSASYHEILIPNAGNFMLETSSAALIEPLRWHLQST